MPNVVSQAHCQRFGAHRSGPRRRNAQAISAQPNRRRVSLLVVVQSEQQRNPKLLPTLTR